MRLALGWTAVVLAGALFYYDWKHGWEACRPFTLPAVLLYFALNGAYTYWLWFVERGVVYAGAAPDGSGVLRIASAVEKHVPTYKVEARVGRGRQVSIQAPFTRWFTQEGVFVPRPFQQWLASGLKVVAKADPANVVEEIGRGAQDGGAQGGRSMNVDLGTLDKVLEGIKSQGQGSGKARRRG